MEARLRQAGGLKHCKNIRRIAKRIWKKSNYRYGDWDECLRSALRLHREKMYKTQKVREEISVQRHDEYLNQTQFERQFGEHVGCF